MNFIFLALLPFFALLLAQVEFGVEEIMYETYMAHGEDSTKFQELVEGRADHASKRVLH